MNKAYIKYIVALVLFGANGIAVSMIDMASTEIVFLRTIIGSLFLIGAFIVSRKRLMFFRIGKQSVYLMMSGIAMGANWMLLFEAYQYIGVSIAMLACYCGPILVMVAASLIFKEKLTQPKVFGLITVIAGMICVNGLAILEEGLSWGLFCGLMSALMYAVMIICNKKVTELSGLEGSMFQLITACVFVGIFMLFTHPEPLYIPTEGIAPLLWLSIVGTGLGFYLYFSAIQTLSAQTVSVCGYLEPLSALLFSAAVLGERLAPLQIVGAVLILSGAVFGEMLSSKRVRRAVRARFKRVHQETLAQ